MILTKIYDKSANKNLHFGYRFKFCGVQFLIYRLAKGKHIVTSDYMQDLIMLDNSATVVDLHKELVKIVDNLYQRRKNKPTVIFATPAKVCRLSKRR